jgi:ribose transport system permease protein
VLEALFLLLNIAGIPSTLRDAVQGVIIIAAVAYSAVAFRARRRGRGAPTSPDQGKEPPVPVGTTARPSASPALSEGDTETRGDQ